MPKQVSRPRAQRLQPHPQIQDEEDAVGSSDAASGAELSERRGAPPADLVAEPAACPKESTGSRIERLHGGVGLDRDHAVRDGRWADQLVRAAVTPYRRAIREAESQDVGPVDVDPPVP